MIGLASQRIDFTSHFLGNETQFLTLPASILHSINEVFQVVAQALFFFVDIQFLNVIDEFLLQTVLVIVHADGLFQSIRDAFFDFLYTLFFVRINRSQQLGNIRNLFAELLL